MIRVSILVWCLMFQSKEREIVPLPVGVVYCSLVLVGRIELNSSSRADPYILFQQHHAIHLGILGNTPEMSDFECGVIVSDDFIAI